MSTAGPRPEQGGSAGATTSSPADHRAVVKELFREHNRALVKFLLTRLSSEQEACDVAQEAYVRLLQLDQPGAISFLQGYLFRIAANLSVDRMRHRLVRERVGAELFEEFSDTGVTEYQAITKQEFDLACSALDELPQRHREAFVRHVVEGYRTPEIARDLGVDERTVRKYVANALLHCRRRLLGHTSGAEE